MFKFIKWVFFKWFLEKKEQAFLKSLEGKYIKRDGGIIHVKEITIQSCRRFFWVTHQSGLKEKKYFDDQMILNEKSFAMSTEQEYTLAKLNSKLADEMESLWITYGDIIERQFLPIPRYQFTPFGSVDEIKEYRGEVLAKIEVRMYEKYHTTDVEKVREWRNKGNALIKSNLALLVKSPDRSQLKLGDVLNKFDVGYVIVDVFLKSGNVYATLFSLQDGQAITINNFHDFTRKDLTFR